MDDNLRRICYKIPTSTAINIYNTINKPHFEYCSTILFYIYRKSTNERKTPEITK